MKIKVTFEKEFDSDDFYATDINDLTFKQFIEDISYDELAENLGPDDFKFEEIKE